MTNNYDKEQSERQNRVLDFNQRYSDRWKHFRVSDDEKKLFGEKFAALLQASQDGSGVTDSIIYTFEDRITNLIGKENVSGKKVLELGSGSGRCLVALKRFGAKEARGVTLGSLNIDFSLDELGLSEGDNQLGLAESLPFADNYFDTVIGFHIIEHAISPPIFIAEQYRVLKPGGKLFLGWPDASVHHGGLNLHHIICPSPGQLKVLVEKLGFINVRCYDISGRDIRTEDLWRSDLKTTLVLSATKKQQDLRYLQDYCALKRR